MLGIFALGRLELSVIAAGLEEQVRPLCPSAEHARSRNSELLQDIRRDLGRRLRGHRQDGRPAERANGIGERKTGGAEIMAPLRDTMRLIDDEHRHAALSQDLQVLGVLQPLWSDIDEVIGAVADLDGRLARLARRERRVDVGDFARERGFNQLPLAGRKVRTPESNPSAIRG